MEELHRDGDVSVLLDGSTVVVKQDDRKLVAIPSELVREMHENEHDIGEAVFKSDELGLLVEYLSQDTYRIEPRLGPEVRLKQSAVTSIVQSLE